MGEEELQDFRSLPQFQQTADVPHTVLSTSTSEFMVF